LGRSAPVGRLRPGGVRQPASRRAGRAERQHGRRRRGCADRGDRPAQGAGHDRDPGGAPAEPPGPRRQAPGHARRRRRPVRRARRGAAAADAAAAGPRRGGGPLVIALLEWRPARAAPDPDAPRGAVPLMHELRRPIRAGVLLIALFFGGIGGWAASAPLAGAAIAPGVISPDGSRRTVQHLEGGIIREILVRDGSLVRAGDPLIVLEDVQARASVDVLRARFHTLGATQARLMAEQAGAKSVNFPAWLIEATDDDPTALEAMVAQRALFETRAKALQDRKDILSRRIEQLREEI